MDIMIRYAVIAAAGMGSRLQCGLPKALVEVCGRSILSYQLELLRDIPHVRIVVGYHGEEVSAAARELRPDIEIIFNHDYASTNTLQSYYLGVKDLDEPFLLLDGDIIPQRESLCAFLDKAQGDTTIGIAPVNTEDAVFVHLDQSHRISSFSRTVKSKFEWSNIVVVHSKLFSYENTYVYEQLEKILPLKACCIERLEIDTPNDIQYAESVLSDPECSYKW